MIEKKYSYIPYMFAYKTGNKHLFSMGEHLFYLTEDEMDGMKNAGATRDDIIVYVYELLSKKKLSDFSEMHNLFTERMHG